jgi:hypothetical protein
LRDESKSGVTMQGRAQANWRSDGGILELARRKARGGGGIFVGDIGGPTRIRTWNQRIMSPLL